MTYVWRHMLYGQYKTKGHAIAFLNKTREIAHYLPRHPHDIIIDIHKVFGFTGMINVDKISKECFILKTQYKHPCFTSIQFSYSKVSALRELCVHTDPLEYIPASLRIYTSIDENALESNHQWSNVTKDRGSNQFVEEEVAEKLVTSPLALSEDNANPNELRGIVTDLFKSVNERKLPPYYSVSKYDDWERVFPTLLPNGKGVPVGVFTKISLREWIQHVISVQTLNFHANLSFIFFANFTFRKHQITGVSACKPISKRVQKALEDRNTERFCHAVQGKQWFQSRFPRKPDIIPRIKPSRPIGGHVCLPAKYFQHDVWAWSSHFLRYSFISRYCLAINIRPHIWPESFVKRSH